MKPSKSKNARKAFTLIELLVVVAIIFIVLAIIPTPGRGNKERALTIQCMSNLRQLGIVFILYAADTGKDQFPWEVSTNSGGTAELVANASASKQFLPLASMGYFKTNTHSTRIFICPTDKKRNISTNFSAFNDSNLSYFVSLDASIKATTNITATILSGDRHLSVSSQPVKPGLLTIHDPLQMAWTREMHDKTKSSPMGVMVFGDGHGEIVPDKKLPTVFQRQSISTNRLLLP